MVTIDLDRAVTVARNVAQRAGELLREGRQRGFEITHKGDVDLVTDYDRRSEELVVSELTRVFPDHHVVGEEGSDSGPSDGPVWLVDPLDGTTNYAHRLPWYSVSIGLEIDGVPQVGVIYAPEMGWDFWAARGRGAHLGQTRLNVSSTADLDQALIATGFPYDRRTSRHNNVPELATLIRRTQGVRRIGVASLDCALTAWGCLDLYWEYKLKPWDISAGALLVLEAGGHVTLPDGSPYRSDAGDIAASNGLLHDQLLAVLAEVRRERGE